MPDNTARIILKAVDQASGVFDQVAAKTKQTSEAGKEAGSNLNSSLALGAGIAGAALFQLAGSAASAIEGLIATGFQVQDTAIRYAAATGQFSSVARDGAAITKSWADSTLNLDTVATTFTTIQQIFTDLPADSVAALQGLFVKFKEVFGSTSIESTARGVKNALEAMGKDVNPKNVTDLLDVIAKLSQKTGIDPAALAANLGLLAPQASAAGIGLNDLATGIATVYETTGDPGAFASLVNSVSGSSEKLRVMQESLARQAAAGGNVIPPLEYTRAKDALSDFGLSITQFISGNPIKTLQTILENSKGIDTTKLRQDLTVLFGPAAATEIMTISTNYGKASKSLTDAVGDASGTVANAAKAIEDLPLNKLDEAWKKLQTVFVDSSAFQTAIAIVESTITSIVDLLAGDINTKPFTDAFNSVGATLANINTSVFDAITGFFADLGTGLVNLNTGAFDAVVGFFDSVGTTLLNINISAFDSLSSFFSDLGSSLSGLSTSSFDAVTNFLTGIGNAASKITDDTFKSIRGVGTKIWGSISSGFTGALTAVGGTGAWLGSNFSSVINLAKSVLDNVGTVGASIWGSISSAFAATLGDVGVWLGGFFKSVVIPGVNLTDVGKTGAAVWNAIVTAFGVAVGNVGTWLGGFFKDVKLPTVNLADVGKIGTTVWNSIKNAFNAAVTGADIGIQFISGLASKLGAFGTGLWDEIVKGFNASIAAVTSITVWLGNNFLSIVFPPNVQDSIKNIGSSIWTWIKTAFNTVFNSGEGAKTWLLNRGADIVTALEQWLQPVTNWAGTLWDGIKTGFNTMFDGSTGAAAWLSNKWNAFHAELSKWWQPIYDVGSNLLKGLIQGMGAAWTELEKKINDIGGDVLKTFKAIFNIKSPSKELEEIGQYIMQGLQIGIDNGGGSVLQGVRDIAGAILGEWTTLSGDLSALFDGPYKQGYAKLVTDTLGSLDKMNIHVDAGTSAMLKTWGGYADAFVGLLEKNKGDILKTLAQTIIKIIEDQLIQLAAMEAVQLVLSIISGGFDLLAVAGVAAAGIGIAALEGLKGQLNSYAVGTPNIPYDQLAMVHKGEMIVPATMAQGVRDGSVSLGGANGGNGVQIYNNFYGTPHDVSQQVQRDIMNALSNTGFKATGLGALGVTG